MREADKRMYYIVSPNSFAYNPARINVGSIGYQNTGKDVIVSSLYEVFKTSDDVDDRLLWHWFKSPDFQKLIFQLQEGGVRLYFYYDKLCMGTVSLPSLEEQRKIGQFFDSLDTLITLHQRKLEKLVQIRKAFAERCFLQSRKEFVMAFTKEADFEEAVVKLLIERGWKDGVLKNYTEQQLIQNWANILFENNRGIDRLNDYPLTDGEMQQIME